MSTTMRLSEAVEALGLGYHLVIDGAPALRPDAVGNPPDAEYREACVCRRVDDGKSFIACKSDSWDFAYSVAHEIAESEVEHKHTADMYEMQCNILAKWCRWLA